MNLIATNFLSGQRARRGALALMAAGVVVVSGCAIKPRVPTTSNAATEVTAQTSRAYHGRFSVQYDDQNGQQRNAYGNFDWQETGDTVTLQLRNPLGQTLAIVTSSPSSATLELPNREPAVIGTAGLRSHRGCCIRGSRHARGDRAPRHHHHTRCHQGQRTATCAPAAQEICCNQVQRSFTWNRLSVFNNVSLPGSSFCA